MRLISRSALAHVLPENGLVLCISQHCDYLGSDDMASEDWFVFGGVCIFCIGVGFRRSLHLSSPSSSPSRHPPQS